jgi:hypothetical protein
MAWYCPKCGQVAVEKNGMWTCSSGGLEFSKDLGDRLAAAYSAVFVAGGTAPLRLPNATSLWFCPACCLPVDPEGSCAQGHSTLKPFLFELVELHPHADGRGKYF